MRKSILLVLAVMVATTASFSQLDELPAEPIPGKCYVRCVTPSVYATEEKRILTSPEYKRLEVVPAEYKTVEDKIMIKPASKKYVYVPAQFKTVTEEIRVEDAYNEISIVPAKLAASSEEIQVRPKMVKYEYQANAGPCNSDNPFDCMTVCAVEYPAETRIVPTQVVDTDASHNKAPKGGKTITIEKQELVSPARCDAIDVPAEFTTITKRVLVKDEVVNEIVVPAEYSVETIEIVKDKGGVKKWEEIDCELTDYNVLPIFYELGSARLTADSRKIIDQKLYALMKEKPLIKIEISSHTDARGSNASNQSLSQRRAESVVNYLVGKGISRSRLLASGFGETRLINRCKDGVECSEAEHQKNRRTEFRVLSGS